MGLPMAIVRDWEYRSAPVIQETLRDNVQISLGTGSYAELEAESKALALARSGGTPGKRRLVVVATWRDDDSFSVRVPLLPGDDTSVETEASTGGEKGVSTNAVRHFRLRPDVQVDAACTLAATVEEVVLETLDRLLARLDLDEAGTNEFVGGAGPGGAGAPGRLFGGLVAAQAFVAAARTGRCPHRPRFGHGENVRLAAEHMPSLGVLVVAECQCDRGIHHARSGGDGSTGHRRFSAV